MVKSTSIDNLSIIVITKYPALSTMLGTWYVLIKYLLNSEVELITDSGIHHFLFFPMQLISPNITLYRTMRAFKKYAYSHFILSILYGYL